jgi:DNA-binding LytR/AlgR family response regulator
MSTPKETRKNEHPTLVPRLIVLMKAARGYHVVDVRTILFAQADSRFCRITCTDGTEKAVLHTLTELEGILCCGERIGELLFFRVHRGYVLALHQVVELDRMTGALLVNSGRIPISKGEWKRVISTGGSLMSYTG